MRARLDREPRPWDRPHWRPEGPEPGDGDRQMPPWLQERLFDQRMVMLSGALTGHTASDAAAALIALDALGAEPVALQLATPDGDLAAAFTLIDVLDSMRSPVNAVVTALTGAAGVGVLTASTRRSAYPHARIRLAEPRATVTGGTADQVAAAAGHYLRELEGLVLRIVERTGQSRSRVEDDLSAKRVFSAQEALEYGLLDDVIGPA